MKNTMKETPSKTSSDCASRRARKIFTGRDDDLGTDAIAHQRWEDVADLTRQERAVLDPVLARVPHGVGHGGRRHLDAVHPPAASRQQETDRPGPGVEVHDRLGAVEPARRL